jgi:hypothetical protein
LQATIQQKQIISAALSLLMLPTTIIWLEIGPQGKAYYSEQVPDIYFLGATILGKDKSFWGIDFAWKFQLSVIIFFFLTTLLSIFIVNRKKIALRLTQFNLLLLLFFPYWMLLYEGGVICNSDGAALDLKRHYGLGTIIYLLLLCWQFFTIQSMRRHFASVNKFVN